MKENVYIISNDKFFYKNNGFISTSNKNIFTILNSLRSKYNINLIARKNNHVDNYFNKIKNVKFLSFKEILELRKVYNKKNFLIVSLTPFNFFIFTIISFLKKKNKKSFLFLRSDGFKEYKIKYFIFGYYFYFFLYLFIKKKVKILTVSKFFIKINKYKIVLPSELNKNWFKKRKIKKNRLKKIKILYLGRFKKEKGFFNIIDIFKKIKIKSIQLTLAGGTLNKLDKNKKLKYLKSINSENKLIKLFDEHDIFLLPSYTEGYPQVILESLARLKPVIIFEEISHLLESFEYGVFVSKRNIDDLTSTIDYIVANYKKIQRQILLNKHITSQSYAKDLRSLFWKI